MSFLERLGLAWLIVNAIVYCLLQLRANRLELQGKRQPSI